MSDRHSKLGETKPTGRANAPVRVADLDTCPNCQYRLNGLAFPQPCPECGTLLEESALVFSPGGRQRMFVLVMSAVSFALLLFCAIVGMNTRFRGVAFLVLIGYVALAFSSWRFFRGVLLVQRKEYLVLTSVGVRMECRDQPSIDARWGQIENVGASPMLDMVFLGVRDPTPSIRSIPGFFRPRRWTLEQFRECIANRREITVAGLRAVT